MRISNLMWVLISALLLTSACSSETPAVPQGLEISLSAQNEGSAPCRIERIARNDQSGQSLYMVRGEGQYSLADGSLRSIPVQIQFLGLDGVVKDTSITLTDFDASCSDVSIEWLIEECTDSERNVIDCPELTLTGQEHFASVDVTFAE